MTALNWLRSKAAKTEQYQITTDEGETYDTVAYYFRGSLPAGLASSVRKELNNLIVTETLHENILIGGQSRSDYGRCEFWRTEYTRE